MQPSGTGGPRETDVTYLTLGLVHPILPSAASACWGGRSLGAYIASRSERFREIEKSPANRCVLDRKIGPHQFNGFLLAQRVGFERFRRRLGEPAHRRRAYRIGVIEKE